MKVISTTTASESHFKVVIVSEQFNGKRLIQRHRSVNQTLPMNWPMIFTHSPFILCRLPNGRIKTWYLILRPAEAVQENSRVIPSTVYNSVPIQYVIKTLIKRKISVGKPVERN